MGDPAQLDWESYGDTPAAGATGTQGKVTFAPQPQAPGGVKATSGAALAAPEGPA